MTENKKPNVSSGPAQKQLDEAQKQFDGFKKEIDSLTLDRMNAAPKEENEQQTKLSQKEIDNSKDIYLKPKRTVASKEKFDESNREAYNFAKEYVPFIAENNELIGASIDLWTKGFPGVPAEWWEVPTNVKVWGPRYLAERIAGCTYHRLTMEEGYRPGNIIGSDGLASYTGNIVVDSVKHRLNAYPASQRKSVFMGASGF